MKAPGVDPHWPRRHTRPVRVGAVAVGGGEPISVQTMTKTDPLDVPATVAQVLEVSAAGASIVRLAIPHRAAADAFREIRQQVAQQVSVPLVADVHFDYRLALAALEA